MPELSIIVPVYKVEPYLPKCIDSILAQTFTDFELILIDDGSPDRCGEICDEYAAKDSRIVVIHQENKGVSAARNAGLDIAKGEYIGFVDSDDWIEKTMYKRLISIMQADDTDIAICGCKQRKESGEFLYNDFFNEGSYNHDQLLRAMISIPNPIGGVLWNKLFKRRIIGSLRFCENMKNCEDGLFIVQTLVETKSGKKIPDPLYNVVQRDLSASRSGNVQQVYHTVLGFVEIRKFLVKNENSRDICSRSAEMLLDNSIRFGNIIKELGMKTKQPCTYELNGIRNIMRKTIIESAVKALLPLRSIHGYVCEMRKLRLTNNVR